MYAYTQISPVLLDDRSYLSVRKGERQVRNEDGGGRELAIAISLVRLLLSHIRDGDVVREQRREKSHQKILRRTLALFFRVGVRGFVIWAG